MRFAAVACDYDGTLAEHGVVHEDVIVALGRLRDSGRARILVTGRELDDLKRVFAHLDLFDRVVAENGAVLFDPAQNEERILAEAPPSALVEALQRRKVTPLSVGRVIVATWTPQETQVLEVIHELGLEHQVIFNKGAVMVLPPGVNKATGLRVALQELGLSRHNTVGIGDAENDHAFLTYCECAVAVANALPSLSERVDWVTSSARGGGVIELIDELVEGDLASISERLTRHAISCGHLRDTEEPFQVPTFGSSLMIAGTSGSGKSTIAVSLLEQLLELDYQICLIDPEGDHAGLPRALSLGDQDHCPPVEEVIQALSDPSLSVVLNLLAVAIEERPAYVAKLQPGLQDMRARLGRPHWLVYDEAHHLFPQKLPADRVGMLPRLGRDAQGLLLITVHPDHVAADVLSNIDVVLTVGTTTELTLQAFAQAQGIAEPSVPRELAQGEAIAWRPASGATPAVIVTHEPRTQRLRHHRKYVAGELGPDKSFYFRGPHGRLNLRAQNLLLFLQLAEGVDDETWLYHLREGDYSNWIRQSIKDDELADEIAALERRRDADAGATRRRIREAIEGRYTLPA
jgi:HAD superfamily hydrolase (TIGR01484 family)